MDVKQFSHKGEIHEINYFSDIYAIGEDYFITVNDAPSLGTIMKKYLVIVDKYRNNFVVNGNNLHFVKMCKLENTVCCEVDVFNLGQILTEPVINVDLIIPIIEIISQNYRDLGRNINEQLKQGKQTKRAN